MKERETYDLIILGGGPTGLAAAIYGGRARLKTLVLEKGNVGGRAHTTREIVNYPGIQSASGPELSQQMEEHAGHFGAQIRREEVKSVRLTDEVKQVETRRHIYEAKAVVLATGTTPRVLGIPGEKELAGLGVAYCATCDAEFFQDQTVVVVGSGDQGIEESMYIAKFARKVIVIVLHKEGVLDCNKQSAEKALAHPKLEFVWNSVLDRVCGEDAVTGVEAKNVQTGLYTHIPCEGVFFFVGQIPATALFQGQVELDERGWVITNEKMETNLPGVYAAGDVRAKYLRQVCTGVADGAVAATAAERYLEELSSFEVSVLQSKEPVALAFWSPEIANSLEGFHWAEEENRKLEHPYHLLEIDVSRKGFLAGKYGVVLNEATPAVVLLLKDGTEQARLCAGAQFGLPVLE